MEGLDESNGFANILGFWAKVLILSPLVGGIFGLMTVYGLRTTNRKQGNDRLLQSVITITSAYLTFYVAQAQLGLSGVLATCASALCVATYGNSLITDKIMMEHVWGFLEWVGNTFLFMLAGLYFVEYATEDATGSDYGFCVLLYIVIMLIRASVLFIFWPIVNELGEYKVSTEEIIFMSWGGLRGALAIALSMVVLQYHEEMHIEVADAKKLFFLIGGNVSMTLIINATTSRLLLTSLGLVGKVDRDHTRTLNHIRNQMHVKMEKCIAGIGQDGDAGSIKMKQSVQQLLKVLNEGDMFKLQKDEENPFKGNDKGGLEKIRKMFLDLVKVQYWKDINSGVLSRNSSNGRYLIYTVDVEEETLDSHIGLRSVDLIIAKTDFSKDAVCSALNYLTNKFDIFDSMFGGYLHSRRCNLIKNRVVMLNSFNSAFTQAENQLIAISNGDWGDKDGKGGLSRSASEFGCRMSGLLDVTPDSKVNLDLLLGESRVATDKAFQYLSHLNHKYMHDLKAQQVAHVILSDVEELVYSAIKDGILTEHDGEVFLEGFFEERCVLDEARLSMIERSKVFACDPESHKTIQGHELKVNPSAEAAKNV